jgi:hypothetical protein
MHLVVLAVVAAVAVMALALLAVLAAIVAGIRRDERATGRGAPATTGCQALAHRVLGAAAPAARRRSQSPSRAAQRGSR